MLTARWCVFSCVTSEKCLSPALSARSRPNCQRPRDLLARLYREIGISAVAAALQVQVDRPERKARVETQCRDFPRREASLPDAAAASLDEAAKGLAC